MLGVFCLPEETGRSPEHGHFRHVEFWRVVRSGGDRSTVNGSGHGSRQSPADLILDIVEAEPQRVAHPFIAWMRQIGERGPSGSPGICRRPEQVGHYGHAILGCKALSAQRAQDFRHGAG